MGLYPGRLKTGGGALKRDFTVFPLSGQFQKVVTNFRKSFPAN